METTSNVRVEEIDMNRTELRFLDETGETIGWFKMKENRENVPLFGYRWVLYVDGVKQEYAKSIEFPRLDYKEPQLEPLKVKLEVYK